MRTLRFSHVINCSADRFWKLFFDDDFNMKLFLEELGFPEFEVLEHVETDAAIRRRVRGIPKMEVPKAVARVLGETFSFEEEGLWDVSTQVWSWKMIPSLMRGKIRNDGKMTIEAIDQGSCRRAVEIEIEAKVFGVGGLIEASSEKQLFAGWDKSATFFDRWAREHPLE